MSYVLTSSNPRSIRAFLLGKIALPSVLIYRSLFKHHKTAWNETTHTLSRYPKESIGHSLATFLQQNKLDLEPKMENHDVFHVVLGYNTSLPEEAALHFFLIGNGKPSHYPFIAALVGFMFFPEHYDLYIDAYHRGKRSKPFVKRHAREWLIEDLIQFRTKQEIPERLI